MNNPIELMKGVKRWTLCAALMAFTCFPLQGSIPNEHLGKGPNPFTAVAKQAIPAVVSVQVKGAADRRSRFGESEPFDFFNDDFFYHFFGTPRRGQERPQQKFQLGQASGFIVSADGHILTNGHVVNQASEITVALSDGREFKAETIGVDTNTDIAVIKIDAKNLPHLTLGNSDDLEVGQWVIAIGNPLGLQASLTAGVVSAKGRSGLDLARIEDFIQTDAAINRGNSGGPLLNLEGEVIGMNTAIVTNMGSGGYMGIGFAIPSNMIHHIMEQLIEKGSVTRGFIGVTLQQVNSDLAQAFGLDKVEGALVSDVSRESPAELAGLKQGDVITEQDGKKVTTIGSLRNAVALMKPGSKMTLTVIRNGKKLTIPLTIGTYPDDDAVSINETGLGIEVEPLTPEIARNLGYTQLNGVLVKKVEPNSAAAWAGLKKGTLILAVNHKEVKSPEEFKQRLKESDAAKPVLLLVKQGDYMHFISLKTH